MIVNGKKSLGEILGMPIDSMPNSSFSVPQFQRKYDWEKENEVSRLIDDVFDDLDRTSFMGTLLFQRSTTSDNEMEIIDGQQRLVTYAIFYRACVDYARKRQSQDRDLFTVEQNRKIEYIIHSMLNRIMLMEEQKARIRLSNRINSFFQNEIILNDEENKVDNLRSAGRGLHPSVKRLRGAYVKIFDAFEQQCGSITGQELVSQFYKIRDALDAKQIFLSLSVEDEADAYNIFETINERGRRLSLSDLVKNLCFSKMTELGDDNLEEFSNNWDEAEESKVSDFGSFLWHVWVSRYTTCPKKQTFKEMSQKVRQMNSLEVFEFTSDMIFNEANHYYTYENPREDIRSDSATRERIRHYEMLKSMHATRGYPLLLGIDYALHINHSISAEQANSMIKAMTSLTFWYIGICQMDAKKLESIFHKYARQIRNTTTESAEHDVSEIINILQELSPPEEIRKISFTNAPPTDAKFIKGLLRNLELQRTIDKLGHEGERGLRSDSDVWLEHILPQNPAAESDWIRSFPDRRDREDYTRKLGNLTLLSGSLDRIALNRSFETKKELCYIYSQIELTKDLLEFAEWNRETINQNTDKLYNLAKRVWPVPE